MTINGTSGDDNLTGTPGDNIFDLSQGGHDTAFGGNGADIFHLGGALDANDKLNGGNDYDILSLDGDYSAGVTFKAHTIQNIEDIDLVAGHSYNLTLNDANLSPLNPATPSFALNAVALGATDQAILDASAELDTYIYFYAGAGDDVLTGGQSGNNFTLSEGGNDIVTGGAGQDGFLMGGALTAADRLNGGGGSTDQLTLDGDYSTQLVFAASTVKNINSFILSPGHNYNLKISDGTFAAGTFADINAGFLGATDHLIFDGSKETDARLEVESGGGDDVMIGGALNDNLGANNLGNDTLIGGGGDDFLSFGVGAGGFTATDRVDGGTGNDSLGLFSDTTVILNATMLKNVEILNFQYGHTYDITTVDKTVATGQTLTVNTTHLVAGDTARFNGAAEKDGHFVFNGGASKDTFVGGALSDTITGGDGADKLVGGGGGDTFVYTAVSNSTGMQRDAITDFHAGSDMFDLDVTVTGVDSAVTAGQLQGNAFNADLATAIGAARLATGHAVLFMPDSGSLAGHTILVVDANGTAGYQANADYVFDVTGGSNLNALSTGDFI